MHVEHTANERTLGSPLQMELHMQSFTLSRRSGAIDQRPSKFGRAMTFAVPLAVATLAASAAYAGADTTFTPALTKFTYMAPCWHCRAWRGPTASERTI